MTGTRLPAVRPAGPTATPPAGAERPRLGVGPTMAFGIAAAALFFGGFAGWAAVAPLESAAIAPGEIGVSGERRTVQHLEGGIVAELRVAEGDAVRAGETVLVLDDTRARAALALVEGRRRSAAALRARLAVRTRRAAGDPLAGLAARGGGRRRRHRRGGGGAGRAGTDLRRPPGLFRDRGGHRRGAGRAAAPDCGGARRPDRGPGPPAHPAGGGDPGCPRAGGAGLRAPAAAAGAGAAAGGGGRGAGAQPGGNRAHRDAHRRGAAGTAAARQRPADRGDRGAARGRGAAGGTARAAGGGPRRAGAHPRGRAGGGRPWSGSQCSRRAAWSRRARG